MTTYGRCDDLTSLVINTTSFLPEIPFDKIGSIYLEIKALQKDYSKSLAVNFIAGNFSKNKHLSTRILNDKTDAEIMSILEDLEAAVKEEIAARDGN